MSDRKSEVIQDHSGEIGLSAARKQEIAAGFIENSILGKEQEDDLKKLSAREAFDLLISARPEASHSAIFLMKEFPQTETVELLKEIRRDPKYAGDIKTIDWILFQFAHQPETSPDAIAALKEQNDPRVVLENEAGKFEMATELNLEEVISLVPALAKNKDWLLKSFREGAVFTLRTKNNELASVAVAHQQPNYVLYLDYIYTPEDKRKAGNAKNLLQYLIKNQVILQCDLFRGEMLSEKVLESVGFKHEWPGEKWIYRAKA